MKTFKTIEDRILYLMEYAVTEGLVIDIIQFYDKIGIHKNNITKFKTGANKFTREQIIKTCKLTKANSNWVLGIEPGPVFRSKNNTNPITLLKEAIVIIEQSKLKFKKS